MIFVTNLKLAPHVLHPPFALTFFQFAAPHVLQSPFVLTFLYPPTFHYSLMTISLYQSPYIRRERQVKPPLIKGYKLVKAYLIDIYNSGGRGDMLIECFDKYSIGCPSIHPPVPGY